LSAVIRDALAPAGVRVRPGWREARVYAAVGLMAGALIALQLAIMRIFAVGSWAHFGSLVVSLAMLGFGLTSAVLCIAKAAVERHGAAIAVAALIAFAPLLAGANLCAQQLPFNAVFMVADPAQRWWLLANFLLYLLPFLAGALFLGIVFIHNRRDFSGVYFADLCGAGIGGGVFVLAMDVVPSENLLLVPLALGAGGAALWLSVHAGRRAQALLAGGVVLAACIHCVLPGLLGLPVLAVSDYKGIAYVRKFPDSKRVYRDVSPFGDLQIYASSYLHFAPGLSDNAAFNLVPLPENAFLGLYVDGDGPVGVMRDLPAQYGRYFEYLPMYYPYLLKRNPKTFVVQFGGGMSTLMALRNNARAVTVAEKNPAVVKAFSDDRYLCDFVGAALSGPNVRLVGEEGRLYLATTAERYDIIDLSLTNSFGLTSPGGFTVTESFAYTREAMGRYMHALTPGGVLAVTVWNKEEPPKSVLKLYATMVDAAHMARTADVARSFFVFANYLSTATVLYKDGGFTDAEVAKLRDHTAAMSFDEIYGPGATDASRRCETQATLSGKAAKLC
jgi:hypothetical protein